MIPFLGKLINGDTSFINIYFIFILYLLQSVSSYLFFAYKSALIKADQKEYEIRGISYITTLLSNLGQIIILLVFKNFSLYVASLIIFNVITNLAIAVKVDKVYPYLREKNVDKISRSEIKGIFKDCYALLIYKVNGVVLNATDNMILSSFIGLEIVGMYSNYLIIVDNIKLIVKMVYNAITASVGNLHATVDTKYENFIFRVLNLATIWICGTAAVGVFIVANDLIQVWLGSEYLIAQEFCILLAINFYIWGLQMVLSTFRNAMGLFQQGKYRPLFGMVINIVTSIALVQRFGIYGVILGTIVSNMLTYMWYDPYIIHKYGFCMKVMSYYVNNILYFGMICLSAVICYFISTLFPDVNIAKIIIMSCVCAIVTSLILFIFNFKKDEYKYLYNTGRCFLTKFVKKNK